MLFENRVGMFLERKHLGELKTALHGHVSLIRLQNYKE